MWIDKVEKSPPIHRFHSLRLSDQAVNDASVLLSSQSIINLCAIKEIATITHALFYEEKKSLKTLN